MRFSGRTWALAGAGLGMFAAAAILTIHSGEKRAAGTPVEPQQRQRPVREPKIQTDSRGPADRDRLMVDLTPEKARELLAKDREEEKNIATRAKKASEIIAQLCRNGFTREAWELLDPNEGLVREESLRGFFRDANLPQGELVSMMDGLQMQERATSLYGYWSRFSAVEFAGMDLSPFPLRSKNEHGVFRRTIENMLAEIHSAGSDPAESAGLRRNLLNQMAKLMNEGTLEYWHLGELVGKDPSKDGFTYWEVAKTVNEVTRSQQNSYQGTDSQIVRAIAIQDAERFMELSLVSGSPEEKKLHIAMEQWLISDYDKAASWYESKKAGFDANYRDRSAAAFMRASAKRKNYQEALAWYAALEADSWKNGLKWEKQQIEQRMKGQ